MMHGRVSRRGARTTRRQRRFGVASLNVTSMMDIFTILVFYLLVNSSNVEVLPNPKAMQLPESIAQQPARETVVLMVTENEILVNNRAVLSLTEAEDAAGPVLAPLKSALLEAPLYPPQPGQDRPTRGEINIMADKDIPYALLKKVMATCTDATFATISLAVLRKTPEA